jgi:hypothetical protein
MSLTQLNQLPGEVVNPLLPPFPILLGAVGGFILLVIIGAAVAAVLLTRKR